MGHPKDEDGGGLPVLVEMPVPVGVCMPAPVQINVRSDETARWWRLVARRATPRSRSAVTYEEVIEKGAQLTWLARVRFPRQIGRPHGRPRKLVDKTLLQFHKTGRLQEAVIVQRRHETNIIGRKDMPTELPGKSVLDIGNVVAPIELAGNKKRRGREHDLPLDHAFRVTQTDILLTLVCNRKGIKKTECWEYHSGQAYPKRLGASTL